MALGSTQPPAEMSIRYISWGVKSGRYIGLRTLQSPRTDCLDIWDPQPPGTLRACSDMYRDCFTSMQLLFLQNSRIRAPLLHVPALSSMHHASVFTYFEGEVPLSFKVG
jgi:hypothetical protein